MKNLDQLSREALGRLFPIVISEPNPDWMGLFVREKENIVNLLGEKTAIRVEHIGSTAVPNLPAKPTIDVLVEIPAGEAIADKIKTILISQGYHYIQDHAEHMMFVKGYTPEGFKGQCYHIHIGPKDRKELWDRLYFRDYLSANPSIASEYAVLKQKLALKFKHDRDAYTEAKTDFIQGVTRKAINLSKTC